MMKLKYLLLLLPFLLTACKKEQLLNSGQNKKVVNLTIQGAIVSDDTLQFVLNDKVLGQGGGAFSFPYGNLLNAGDQVKVIKKADGKVIATIDVAAKPFNQVKKIFYDGKTLSDNIALTPVTDTTFMGSRFRFSTSFKDFYGGPVDLELFDSYVYTDPETYDFIFTYTSIKTLQNITGSFGDFIELPPLEEGHSYKFKIYKAGNKELPYTSTTNLQLSDPVNNYSDIEFTPGESKLLSISPYTGINDGVEIVSDSYILTDYSSYFK